MNVDRKHLDRVGTWVWYCQVDGAGTNKFWCWNDALDYANVGHEECTWVIQDPLGRLRDKITYELI